MGQHDRDCAHPNEKALLPLAPVQRSTGHLCLISMSCQCMHEAVLAWVVEHATAASLAPFMIMEGHAWGLTTPHLIMSALTKP